MAYVSVQLNQLTTFDPTVINIEAQHAPSHVDHQRSSYPANNAPRLRLIALELQPKVVLLRAHVRHQICQVQALTVQ